MYPSTKYPACLYKNKNAEKVPVSEAAGSSRGAGKRTISKPPSVNSAADTQKSQSAQPPQKFSQNDSVYNSEEKDGSGRPQGQKGKRYWICCIKWDQKKKTWLYKLKDGEYPHGKDDGKNRWVEERHLREWLV